LIPFLLSRQRNLNEMANEVAELFVEVLTAAGVERIYGVAGDSLNGALSSSKCNKVDCGWSAA
jgi:hypothetical protein